MHARISKLFTQIINLHQKNKADVYYETESYVEPYKVENDSDK